VKTGLKGKILKFMSDILKDGSYYKLYTQAKSTSACGLPKGFLNERSHGASLKIDFKMYMSHVSALVYYLNNTSIYFFSKKNYVCFLVYCG